MITKKANQSLFLELERDAFALDQCIQEFSDPSLKGDGKFKNIDDYESLRPDYDGQEQLGVTEDGKLKIVKRTYFKKQIDEAESQKEKISKALRYVQKELRKCESELNFRKKALKSIVYLVGGLFRAAMSTFAHGAVAYLSHKITWIVLTPIPAGTMAKAQIMRNFM
jgi:hypothetical protein